MRRKRTGIEMCSNSDFNSWYHKGKTLYDIGNLDEALRCLDMAIEQNPGYADAWFLKARTLDLLSRYDEAIKCYDKVIELDSSNVEAWSDKGKDLCLLERYDEALKCLDMAVELDHGYVDAWCLKGKTLYFLDKHEEALKSFDRAVELNPDDNVAKDNRARILTRLSIDRKTMPEDAESFRQRMVEQIRTGIREEIEEEKRRAGTGALKGNELHYEYGISAACVVDGLIDEALMLAEAMLELAPLAYERNIWGYGYACAALIKAGKAERAWSMINEDEYYVRNFTMRVVAEALAETGDFDEAIRIANDISIQGDRLEALRIICIDLCSDRHDKVEEASKFLEDNPRLYADDTVRWEYCKSLIGSGRYDAALKVARSHGDINALCYAANELTEKGQFAEAEKLLTEELDLGGSEWPPLKSQMAIILAKVGRVEEALKAARELALVPEETWYKNAIESICEALGRSGEVDQALRLVWEFESKGKRWHNDMLKCISRGLSESGDTKRAVEAARRIIDRTIFGAIDREFAIWHIAEDLVRRGQAEDALDRFLFEIDASHLIELWKLIMKACIERGLLQKAAAIAEEYKRVSWLLEVYNAARSTCALPAATV
jgi:tetratricopeptide (TPR) repeat protein